MINQGAGAGTYDNKKSWVLSSCMRTRSLALAKVRVTARLRLKVQHLTVDFLLHTTTPNVLNFTLVWNLI